ncbi:MAG: response regulator [Ruminococcus sp.]|jgi:signal transduction histidine kinase/CheY-like chemotaxis protein/HPt (histidine-containing phosphotransfer) domain-containing protein|nr:response regulator [Ruminococcus sp.]
MIKSEYKIANHVGRFGIMLYGILRFLEDVIVHNNSTHGISVIIICIVTTSILAIIQTLMKDGKYVPLVTGILIMAVFLIGAFYLRDFGYYYISMLCVVGIVCIYLNFKNVLIFFFISVTVNIPLYFTVFQNPEHANLREMVIDGILFVYGFVFLLILSYRLAIRDTAAQNGLNALSSLLKTTPNMMLIVDEMRNVSYISKKMAAFADCPMKYAVGRPVLDLFRDFDIKMLISDIIENESYFEDVRMIDVKGEPRYFKIVCDKLESDNQNLGGMFIDVADITATVLSKLEAEHEKEIATRANISKSKFLATMSHEIRTPMNAIIGISQMQMGRSDLPPDADEAIGKIYASGHGLLGIINDILDLSKIETGKLEILPSEYALPSLINDTVHLYITHIGSKPIEFSLEIAEDTPAKLFGDELRIKQILGNILTNAFKYTDSGSVKMSVKHEKSLGGINLIISVSDTGQGMKPEDAAALGNEFARFNLETNRSTEGTGLGMSITKRLLGLMNGSMDIQSEFGVGSVFTVTIPQESAGSETIGTELASTLSDFTYSRDKQAEKMQIVREAMPYGNVLVVDDVETNLYVAEGLLKPYGITVTSVTSGFAAIDLIKAGKIYDILFMDHMMPVMDGIETVEKIRRIGYTAPIAALTANALTGNEAMFREKGFDDFISKPIDIRRLNTVLNRFVRDKEKAVISKPIAVTNDGIPQKLLEVFLRDTKKAIPVLSKYGKDDLKLFVTTAHAMKSACANVGNNELSEIAKSLEAAGRAADTVYIENNVYEFIEKLNEFVFEITPKNEQELLSADIGFLRKTLSGIASACDDYDADKVNELLLALREYKWSEEIVIMLEEISKLILHAEFEKAHESILTYISIDSTEDA